MPSKKIKSVKMEMEEIWKATRPNVYSTRKKYSRKDRRESRITPSDIED